MRKLSTIALKVILAFVTSGCERDSVVDCSCPAPPDEFLINIAYKKTAYGYQCCDNQVAVRFANLMQDSRCPINATCVWQGTSIIGITLNGDEKMVIPLEIHKPVQAEIMDVFWNIELTELTPHPVLDQVTNPNDYIAKIRMKKN